MTGLFARLYLDEDVSVHVAKFLRARGYDVLTTVGADQLGTPDRKQLEFSAGQDRVLVTHNRRDFERLAVNWFEARMPHAGIIIAVRRPAREIGMRLIEILNRITSDEMIDRIVYI